MASNMRHIFIILAIVVFSSFLLLRTHNDTTSLSPFDLCIYNDSICSSSLSSVDPSTLDRKLESSVILPSKVQTIPSDSQDPVDLNTQVPDRQDGAQPTQNPTTTDIKIYPFTIVTAFSSNHLCAFEAFIHSLQNVTSKLSLSSRPRIVVYSLGLIPKQLPIIEALRNAGYLDVVIDFDWDAYPRFWQITQPSSGQYAWKIGVMNDAARRFGGIIFWFDAGDRLSPKAVPLLPRLVSSAKGFWSPHSAGKAIDWIHPGMFEWFGERAEDYAMIWNCNGAVFGVDFGNLTITENFWKPLVECALDKECIGPEGASRANHRHDQSALTIMAQKNNFQCRKGLNTFGIITHNDRNCWKDLREFRKKGKLLSPSFLDLKFSPGEVPDKTE